MLMLLSSSASAMAHGAHACDALTYTQVQGTATPAHRAAQSSHEADTAAWPLHAERERGRRAPHRH